MSFSSKEKQNEWKRQWYRKNQESELLRKKLYHATPQGKEVLYKSIERYRKSSPEKQKAR